MEATSWNKLGQETISELIEWTKGAKDFVSEQAPELVREVLSWGFWSHAITAIMCLILIPIMLVAAYKLGRGCMDKETSAAFGATLALSITSAGLMGIMFYNTYQAIYVTVAPRMYLLEYLKGLVEPAT